MEIKDQKYLSRFLAEFCDRPVRGKAHQAGIARLRIEVTRNAGGLLFSVCDYAGSLIDVQWTTSTAHPLRYHPNYDTLHYAFPEDLHVSITRFLKKHGALSKLGVAA